MVTLLKLNMKCLIFNICYMKKSITILFFVALLASACTPQESNLKNVGVMLPLTGYASYTGELLKQGVDMALDSLDFSTYKIMVEDNQVNAKTAISVYNSLVAKGYSCFITGGAPTTMAIAPLSKGKDQVLFATAVNTAALTDVTDRVIRLSPTGKSMASKLAEYNFKELHLKKTSIVYINIEMGDEFRTGYKNRFIELGGNVISEYSYESTQRDFKDIINKMVADKPDGVYVVGVGENLCILIQQILQHPEAKNVTVTGDFNFSSAGVIKALGDLSRDIYYTDINVDEQFAQSYVHKYNQPVSVYPAFTFALLQIYKEVLESGEAETPTDIYNAIIGKSFKTVVNTITFDDKGEPTFDIVFKKLSAK